ncbi:putative HECT-type ubiquitin ligase-interacting protein creD [Colletotrichum spinosum]|uniref:Putative HECT-type ubiquitin ligase-interacting protein creD n=1 Tax=Colletotrichum spinosum TaxID=1347390 RepID=A0A4R8QIT3_9PEZI|nr:putative HECT-type ubiquitin ligase-interacting protein creD [Colletotrichum spinosum]
MPSSFRTVRVLEHESPPFVFDHGLKVPAETPSDTDTYEWPFEIMIPGDTPETFRGCSRCSIAYQLTATTIRNKSSSSTPQAYRPVRISRTLGNSAFELMDASTVEGTWADKVKYSISIGHRAVALATAIPLEMRLTPLSDETRFSTVRCELLEEHRFQLGSRPVASAFLGDRTVAEWVAPVENHQPGCEYTMAEKLGLPAEPKRCSPDVDTNGVEISHKLHVVVDVTAANDATFKASGRCQYHATIPVTLFVSPAIPIDASERFVWPEKLAAADDLPAICGGLEIPPVYGDHECDEIVQYSERAASPESPT